MHHDDYIARCLELAEGGIGFVHPNPLVGCVIVNKGKVVGEGFHSKFGGRHAEIMALKNAGRKARGGTLYVNLEPCSHHGKTPPCTDAIIRSGIRTVVASSRDPNPLVAGRGFRRLRQAGIRVMTGTLRREARELNEKFFKFMETGMPFVGMKVAQTVDGKIADSRGTSQWITSDVARAYGHVLRSSYDAVLVGARTIRMDNPSLTVRAVKGRNPVRVVVDGAFSIDARSKILRNSEAETVVLTSSRSLRAQSNKAVVLERRGVQVLGLDSGRTIEPAAILKVLAELGITSVLIEGGGATLQPFLREKKIDKIHCFVAPKLLGSGVTGVQIDGILLRNARRIDDMTVSILGDDLLLEGTLR